MAGHTTTRRVVLQGFATAAVVGMPSAIAHAAPAGNPDAALFTAIAEHARAISASERLAEINDRLALQFNKMKPERPAELRCHPLDGFGVGHEMEIISKSACRIWYGDRQIRKLRQMPPATRWEYPESGKAFEVPDLSRLGRADRIIAAHDAWKAECAALSDRIGLTKAEGETTAAEEVTGEVEMQILGILPKTLAGFIAKARWIAEAGDMDWAEQVIRDLCALGAGRPDERPSSWGSGTV